MLSKKWLTLSVCMLLPIIGCAADQPPEQPVPTRLPAAERIVAIGDLHGDLAATRRALRLAGAIDEHDRWSGGRLVVVQTGDQLDRGNDEREIIALLERLEEEARRAGGALHVLNGNHEYMNVSLDLRYVRPGAFAPFDEFAPLAEGDALLSDLPAEQRGRGAAFRPGGPYALKLAERNTVMIIGENLFVHGGILPAHIDYGLDRINEEGRRWLRGQIERPDWVADREGPLWTRYWSQGMSREHRAELESVLGRLGVKRMIVGHTIQTAGIAAYADARIWCIDVGMAAHYGGVPSVLEIRGNSVRVFGTGQQE
jgi:hypothetical protein